MAWNPSAVYYSNPMDAPWNRRQVSLGSAAFPAPREINILFRISIHSPTGCSLLITINVSRY
jgi:hypothetical protein